MWNRVPDDMEQHSTSHGITFQNKYTTACVERHLYKDCLNAPPKIREAENEDKKTHPHIWHFAVCRLKSGCSTDVFARVRAYIIYKRIRDNKHAFRQLLLRSRWWDSYSSFIQSYWKSIVSYPNITCWMLLLKWPPLSKNGLSSIKRGLVAKASAVTICPKRGRSLPQSSCRCFHNGMAQPIKKPERMPTRWAVRLTPAWKLPKMLMPITTKDTLRVFL